MKKNLNSLISMSVMLSLIILSILFLNLVKRPPLDNVYFNFIRNYLPYIILIVVLVFFILTLLSIYNIKINGNINKKKDVLYKKVTFDASI